MATALAVSVAAGVLLVLPMSITAYRKNEIAHRTRQIQRSEALNQMRQTEEKTYSARVALLTKNETHGLRKQGLALTEEVAASYGAGRDDHWLSSPHLTGLDGSEQRELLTNLGDTFLIAASSCRQEADDRHDDAVLGTAKKWNQLAETCFAKLGTIPDRVAKQRNALEGRGLPRLPERAEKPADLEKLDEADLYSLASELFTAGRYRRASAALKLLTHRDPSNFMAWYLQGLSSYHLGDIHAGINAFTVSIALRPDFSWAFYNRGLLLFEMNQLPDSLADFDRAIALHHHSTTLALVHRAVVKRQLQDYAGADKDLTAALDRDDAPMRTWYLRAAVRRMANHLDDAQRDFVKAESLVPSNEVDWATRGYMRMKDDPKAALQDFDRALEINPRYLHALQNKAVVLAQQPEKALQVMDKLVEFYPDRVQAHADRGVVLARLGRAGEAAREGEFALALDRSAFCRYQIGSLYALLAKQDPKYKTEALNQLSEALRLGLEHRDLFKTDTDLNPIRDDVEFRKLAEIALTLQARPANNNDD